jgi:hypothetical protein
MKKIAVHKNWLLIASGILWSGVGILLINLAARWLMLIQGLPLVFSVIGGLVLGSAIAFFGFRHIALKNISRIEAYQDKVCFFAFQRWQSYFLILVMMSMGIFLRTTNVLPKPYLATLYIGIGMALFSCSFLYYRRFYKRIRKYHSA